MTHTNLNSWNLVKMEDVSTRPTCVTTYSFFVLPNVTSTSRFNQEWIQKLTDNNVLGFYVDEIQLLAVAKAVGKEKVEAMTGVECVELPDYEDAMKRLKQIHDTIEKHIKDLRTQREACILLEKTLEYHTKRACNLSDMGLSSSLVVSLHQVIRDRSTAQKAQTHLRMKQENVNLLL
eukprot:Lithocolla_globosa_v1_NODE_1164_length_2817_cov_15.905899.p1 type:complete len:177 gc:universal NODE_1164_length_2817_cov_15.905899:2348-1818(-)